MIGEIHPVSTNSVQQPWLPFRVRCVWCREVRWSWNTERLYGTGPFCIIGCKSKAKRFV